MAKTPTKPIAPQAAPAKAAKPTASAATKATKGKAAPSPPPPAPAKTTKATASAPAKVAKGKSAPPAPPPPAPEKARTITINQMAVAFAEKHEMSRKDATSMLTEVFDAVVQHVKAGDKVRIAGLGVIELRSRAARMGRNPATGEAIQIAASRKIAFRVAKELKEAV